MQFGKNTIESFRRLAQLAAVLIGATFLLSLLLRLLPIGLKELYVNAPDEASRIKQIRELGLDKNFVSYYF